MRGLRPNGLIALLVMLGVQVRSKSHSGLAIDRCRIVGHSSLPRGGCSCRASE